MAKHNPARFATPLVTLVAAASVPLPAAPDPNATTYPMSADQWEGEKVTFDQVEGFPAGRMTVAEGFATLKTGLFGEGTIEFDMKPLAFSDTGILLHRLDADTAEFVYVRADPDCPAANDCVQYAPITHGRMQWNIYPDYQSGAPISEKGWNHLRLAVADGRLRLFVNHATTPSLDVARLQGLAASGGIAVKGPAVFANLIVRPADRGEPAAPVAETAGPGVIRRWSLGPLTPFPADHALSNADAPTRGWRPFDTEPNGLANLSRAIPRDATTGLSVAWLKVSVDALTAGERIVDLGFATRAWLFLNGAQVYAGSNLYYPSERRLTPEGRYAVDNAKVRLPLRKGRNELVLAVDNMWRTYGGTVKATPYGWAGSARFERPAGLTFRP